MRAARVAIGNPREREGTFANLLASVSGRIYYNIGNWVRLFSLAGLDAALPAWREALGIEETDQTGVRAPPLTKARAAISIARRALTLSRKVDAFHARMKDVRSRFDELDLEQMDRGALLSLEARLQRELVAPYAVSVVNDFVAQQLFGTLGHLVERWRLGDRDSVRNQLLCGVDGVDGASIASVDPVRSLFAIAEEARKFDAILGDLRGQVSAADCWRRICEEAELAPLAAMIREHCRDYGDRTLEELKLETTGLAEDPVAMIPMLRNIVCRRAGRGGQSDNRPARLAGDEMILSRLSWPKRQLFRKVLGTCRRLIGYREALRLERTRGFALFKRVYRQLGAQLARSGHIETAADVFWMMTAELRKPPLDIAETIRSRKADYAADRELALPPRIALAKAPTSSFFRYNGPRAKTAAQTKGRLKGIACSGGRVQARARVLSQPSPDIAIDGEILVAPMTDPGWVYLMVASSGLVVEKGSVLSHTAIIGRELGIPTVIGVANATSEIADGQTIEIDGSEGWVDRYSASETRS